VQEQDPLVHFSAAFYQYVLKCHHLKAYMRLHVVTCQEPIVFVVTDGKTECILFYFVDVQLFAAVRSCTWLYGARNECIKVLLDYSSCLTLYSLVVSVLFHMQLH